MSRNALAFPGGGVSLTRRLTSARQRSTSRPTCGSLTVPALSTSSLLNNAIDEQIVDASLANDAGWTAASSRLAAESADVFVASVGCVPQAAATSARTK